MPACASLESWEAELEAALHDSEAVLQHHASGCARSAPARFFETQGEDFLLSFNGLVSVPIIGRKTWGAGPFFPEGRSFRPYPQEASVCSWFRRITVHHTHTPLSITALQKYHQTQTDPKADIGYHFYIDAKGQIYEARPLGYMGSHTEADNSYNLGIVLNGDFTQQKPPAPQLAALRQLLQALRCPCGFREGIFTHQQRKTLQFPGDPAHFTECPGAALAEEVYRLAEELEYGPVTRISP